MEITDNADSDVKSYNTLIADGNKQETIDKASEILRMGGLVALPTETVYGLGGDALNPSASQKIYAAKGRPSDNPLIVHIAKTTDVDVLAREVPDSCKMLMEAFWPGPLTLVLPKSNIVPDSTTGGLDTVAIRMPSHPIARKLILESGVYIAAPSANTSGRPSPTEAAHVIQDMQGKIDMIIDGGAVGIGIESTIVDLTGDTPSILRPGFITKAMLESIVGNVTIDPALIEPNLNLKPKAPGMKYTHYAPKGKLSLVESDDESKVFNEINRLVHEKENSNYKVAVLSPSEHVDRYICNNILILGERENGETIAANLYKVLRLCDDLNIDFMYSEAFGDVNLGGAIMNRLLKAAGQRVIHV